MPSIPPSLLSRGLFLVQGPAQSTSNASLPHIDIPEMPSLPSSDSIMKFFRMVYQAIVKFFIQIGTSVSQFVKDHPQEVKVAVIIVVVVIATILLLWFVLPVLLSALTAIGTGLASIFQTVITGVASIIVGIINILLSTVHIVFLTIQRLFQLLTGVVLERVGFTEQGVAAGSVAARVQSAVYGEYTTGVFSNFQRQGATIGRRA